MEVVDPDDTTKLEQWFEERWNDRFCLDISEKLAEIIDESWAGRLSSHQSNPLPLPARELERIVIA